MQVDHWGLHWEGPYPFLVEPQGSVCLLYGHEDWVGSFESPKHSCPHNLIRHIRDRAEPAPISPFVPVPDTQAYSYLGDWRRLTSTVEPWWARKPHQLARQLTATNITPLCIIGHRWNNLDGIIRLLEVPRIRPIIFLGNFIVPGTIEISNQEPFSPQAGLATLRKLVNETAP